MRMLKNQELAAFASQFSMILKSGISSAEGLSLLLEDAQNEEEKRLLHFLYEEASQTGELSPAFEKCAQFPSYFLNMLRIGEETGSLDDVMCALAEHYEREHMISKSLKNALTYPLVMIGMIGCIIILLLTKVMPIFEQVFEQLGMELSGTAKGFLNLGAVLREYWFVAILFIAALGFGIYYIIKKKYNLKPSICASRFAGCMALTLKSGLIPERGFEFANELISDAEFAKKMQAANELFVSGETLANALQKAKIFSGTYARLLMIADKTGGTDEVLGQIADQYEDEIYDRIHSLIAALEPTLVVILSIVVGMILFSVMFPLMGMLTSL